MKMRNVIGNALVILLILLPAIAVAQGLVPCGYDKTGLPLTNCTPCDLYKLIQNIINFLIELSIPIAVFLMAYAGVLLFTANANPGKITQARRIFTSAMVGLAIALSGWLLVQVIINTLVSKQFQSGWSWNNISQYCHDSRLGVDGTPITVSDWLNNTIGQGTTVPITSTTPGIPGEGDTCSVSAGGPGSDTCSIQNGLNTAQCAQLIQQATSLNSGSTLGSLTSIEKTICYQAGQYIDTCTENAPGTQNGTLACAYAVNQILGNADIALSDNGVGVDSLETALQRRGAQKISATQAQCGDIAFETGNGHVGICVNKGCTQIISNSTSCTEFAWCSDGTFGGKGTHVIYKIVN